MCYDGDEEGVANIFGEALNGCTTTDLFFKTINLIQHATMVMERMFNGIYFF